MPVLILYLTLSPCILYMLYKEFLYNFKIKYIKKKEAKNNKIIFKKNNTISNFYFSQIYIPPYNYFSIFFK